MARVIVAMVQGTIKSGCWFQWFPTKSSKLARVDIKSLRTIIEIILRHVLFSFVLVKGRYIIKGEHTKTTRARGKLIAEVTIDTQNRGTLSG